MTRKNAPSVTFPARFADFLADENGASAVEYGILVALISIAIMSTLFTLGGGIKTTLNAITTALASL